MSGAQPLRLAVDGVAFQRTGGAAARIWAPLLPALAGIGGVEVVLLDRGGSPPLPGVELRPFPSYTATYTANDSLLLQAFCDEAGADVFASTGFTSVLTTPQVQVVHDVAPEAAPATPSRASKERRLALSYAGHFACTSAAARENLLRACPDIPPDRAAVAHCGVDVAVFNASASAGLEAWRQRSGIGRDYVVVDEVWQDRGFGSAGLLSEALRLDPSARLDLVRVGGHGVDTDLPGGVRERRLDLSDAERAAAYSGAIALIHTPSRDGVGLPVVEAMASGCPVIATRHGALAEVAGDAALFVSGRDPRELLRALYRVQLSKLRRGMTAAGLARARSFDRDSTARRLRDLVRAAAAERGQASVMAFHRRWEELRTAQAEVDVGVD